MPMKNLAMTYGDMPCPMKSPESDKHYPTFHYEGPEDLGLPDGGTLEIKFVKTGSSISESDGKKRYSCTVEVREILEVEGEEVEAPTKSYSKGSDEALDALMAALTKGKKDA